MSNAAVLLRTLTEAAYPKPWRKRKENGDYTVVGETGPGWVDYIAQEVNQYKGADAALIVALRNAADEIADLIEAAETVVILEYDRTRTDAENDKFQRRGKAFREALAAVERALRP